MTAPTAQAPAGVVLPSRDDPVAAGAVQAIGGPPGRHAGRPRSRFWSPVRVLVALTLLTCTLGFLQKAPCRTNPWAHNYQYTHAVFLE